MSCYQYIDSHYKDRKVSRSFYLSNGNLHPEQAIILKGVLECHRKRRQESTVWKISIRSFQTFFWAFFIIGYPVAKETIHRWNHRVTRIKRLWTWNVNWVVRKSDSTNQMVFFTGVILSDMPSMIPFIFFQVSMLQYRNGQLRNWITFLSIYT